MTLSGIGTAGILPPTAPSDQTSTDTMKVGLNDLRILSAPSPLEMGHRIGVLAHKMFISGQYFTDLASKVGDKLGQGLAQLRSIPRDEAHTSLIDRFEHDEYSSTVAKKLCSESEKIVTQFQDQIQSIVQTLSEKWAVGTEQTYSEIIQRSLNLSSTLGTIRATTNQLRESVDSNHLQNFSTHELFIAHTLSTETGRILGELRRVFCETLRSEVGETYFAGLSDEVVHVEKPFEAATAFIRESLPPSGSKDVERATRRNVELASSAFYKGVSSFSSWVSSAGNRELALEASGQLALAIERTMDVTGDVHLALNMLSDGTIPRDLQNWARRRIHSFGVRTDPDSLEDWKSRLMYEPSDRITAARSNCLNTIRTGLASDGDDMSYADIVASFGLEGFRVLQEELEQATDPESKKFLCAVLHGFAHSFPSGRLASASLEMKERYLEFAEKVLTQYELFAQDPLLNTDSSLMIANRGALEELGRQVGYFQQTR